jgi:hypothetical protein
MKIETVLLLAVLVGLASGSVAGIEPSFMKALYQEVNPIETEPAVAKVRGVCNELPCLRCKVTYAIV